MKKHLVLMCLLLSVGFICTGAYLYPGGSLHDKNSVGFDWTQNFISNLFQPNALNGAENPSRVWATIGMAFNSVGIFYYTLFLYGFGDWGLLAIMQKVTLICSMLLVLGFEYFTNKEDFRTNSAII